MNVNICLIYSYNNKNEEETDTSTDLETQFNPDTPATKGTKLSDKTSGSKLVVTSSDVTNPTVAYAGTTKKSAKVKIPSRVTVDGISYKVILFVRI